MVKVKTRTGAVFPFSPGGYTNNQNNLENMDETKKASWEKGQKKPPHGMAEGSERAGSEPGGVPMKEETFKILFWNGRILNQRYHQLCGIIPHLK